jgi:hypothetical protein
VNSFFSVIAKPQSYVNILYLLLAFQLGIGYFIFLVTGISLGAGLLVIWVGVPILAFILAGSWACCEFERVLTVKLLHEDIRHVTRGESAVNAGQDLGAGERLLIGAWRRLKSHLANRLTWTGMLYLFAKFSLGIGSFVMIVVLVSVTGSFLGAPFYYWVDDGADMGFWRIDELWEALVLMFVGIPMTFISLHLMNGAAIVQGRFAKVMLGRLS